MKKRLLIIILCVLCAAGVFGLAACSTTQLAAPRNMRISTEQNGDVLAWSAVENAKTYMVEINGESKQTRRTEMELSRFSLANGTYTVRVKAVNSDYKDSEWSSLTYQKNASTELLYSEYTPGEYAVAGIGGASGEIRIEDEYNGLPVTHIAEGVFAGSSNVTKVVIGKNVKSIGVRAFGNCSFLTDIEFAEDGNLTEIMYGAFQSCIGLTEVEIPDAVTTLGQAAFAYCRKMTSIVLPDSLAIIDSSVFAGCEALTEITVPENVTSIGSRSFADCTGLKRITLKCKSAFIDEYAFSACGAAITEDNPLTDENKLVIDLGKGITSISKYAFQSITALDSIVIPDSVISLGSSVFGACSSLANVHLGKSIEEIGAAAFRGTKLWADAENYVIIDRWLVERKNPGDTNGNLKSLDIIGIAQSAFANGTLERGYELPDSLVYINSYAFRSCNMTSVTMGSGVKIIGNFAFYDCPLLRTVVLGNSVEEIGMYAFAKCTLLTAMSSSGNKNINIPRSVKKIGGNAFFETALWTSSTDMIVVDNWVVGCHEEASGVLNIPSGTVGIADQAFNNCELITGVYVPPTVEIIGEAAFFNCKKLASITIPTGVKEIKIATFYNCTALTSINIPSGVETIEAFAFRSCSKLAAVAIPDSVTKIGIAAFSFCDYLSDVKLGGSVEELGEYAFAYCVSLNKITLPDSLMDIAPYAFYRCSALAEIDFGKGVRSIGSHAFYQCTMLSELDMPDNITSIGDYAFYKCEAMWKLKIGDNVSTVGDHAFYGCRYLSKVVIPDSVENVGDCAFMNCYLLDSVTLGVNLTTLGEHMFMNCRRLTIYAEASKAYSTWDGLWNSQFRPVLWGCKLADDKSYVESVTIAEATLANGNAQNGVTAPTRMGWTFVGWATTAEGEVAYDADKIGDAAVGTTLYALWEQTETKPEIKVMPAYKPGWDTNSWMTPGGLEVTNPDDYFNAGLDDIL